MRFNVLSCLTNVTFEYVQAQNGEPAANISKPNQFFCESGWLDNHPIGHEWLQISKRDLRFIEDLLDGKNCDARIERAANVFHQALTHYYNSAKHYDIATILFVSALEAIDVPLSKPNACQECGQLQHKVSKRIVELAVKRLG